MWIGGYSDWTPAEQREWDHDLEKLEAQRDQQELNETENVKKTNQQNGDNQELSWLELAIDFPLFHVTYRRIWGYRYVCGRLNPILSDTTRATQLKILKSYILCIKG